MHFSTFSFFACAALTTLFDSESDHRFSSVLCMVHGVWCMVHGAWCMVHGVVCLARESYECLTPSHKRAGCDGLLYCCCTLPPPSLPPFSPSAFQWHSRRTMPPIIPYIITFCAFCVFLPFSLFFFSSRCQGNSIPLPEEMCSLSTKKSFCKERFHFCFFLKYFSNSPLQNSSREFFALCVKRFFFFKPISCD